MMEEEKPKKEITSQPRYQKKLFVVGGIDRRVSDRPLAEFLSGSTDLFTYESSLIPLVKDRKVIIIHEKIL